MKKITWSGRSTWNSTFQSWKAASLGVPDIRMPFKKKYLCKVRMYFGLFLTLHFLMTVGYLKLVFPRRPLAWYSSVIYLFFLFVSSKLISALCPRPGHLTRGAQCLHLPFLAGLEWVTLSLQEANIHCTELQSSISFCLNVRWIYVIALGSGDPWGISVLRGLRSC